MSVTDHKGGFKPTETQLVLEEFRKNVKDLQTQMNDCLERIERLERKEKENGERLKGREGEKSEGEEGEEGRG